MRRRFRRRKGTRTMNLPVGLWRSLVAHLTGGQGVAEFKSCQPDHAAPRQSRSLGAGSGRLWSSASGVTYPGPRVQPDDPAVHGVVRTWAEAQM